MKKNISKCSGAVKKRDLDAILISDPINITYLTGFRLASGYLLVTGEEELFYFTSFLYEKEARLCKCWKVVANNDIFDRVKVYIKKLKLKKVGFEAKLLPFLEYKKIKGDLASLGIDFLETVDLVEDLRAIKNLHEISMIKKSIKISEEAFEFISEIYDDKMTEKDLSIEIDRFLRQKGDNSIAFDTIVASGKNSAHPHHLAVEMKMESKFVLIDLGSKYCGYCADLTRVFFWSKMPVLFSKIYDILKGARDVGIRKIRDGVMAKEVDSAAREFIARKGFSQYFGHGLGHGVGLAVHERPYLCARNEDVLKEGMVLTVEPAIYLPNKFGVRIEDMVLVKKNKAEVLSGNADW
ncbi:MAG: Xaa-Pro peptidase family protein [Candidatus Omnitrophota bacterium]|nr:Xaa-Pro peptidase family protein [Candidatus Omnitrophota bacterium]